MNITEIADKIKEEFPKAFIYYYDSYIQIFVYKLVNINNNIEVKSCDESPIVITEKYDINEVLEWLKVISNSKFLSFESANLKRKEINKEIKTKHKEVKKELLKLMNDYDFTFEGFEGISGDSSISINFKVDNFNFNYDLN